MPRTKLTARAEAKNGLAMLIRANSYAAFGGVSKAAPHAGISQATMSRRMQDVEEFSIAELSRLRKSTNIPKETLLKALEELL